MGGGTHFSHLNHDSNTIPDVTPQVNGNQLELDSNRHILNDVADMPPNTVIEGVELPGHFYGGGLDTIIKNGKVSIDDIKTNPSAFSEKSAEEIAEVLRHSGYDVTIKNSTRSRSGAQIIQVNNHSGGKNISQVQVSPGGGRHGSNPYVKISTTDQGIIKIVDGIESTYKTDGKETATIIFSGGN